MKYKKIPSINETIKKASMVEARNMSALPAMRFISNVTPSRRNVSNGRRKVQRPEDKKSVGEIDWNSFAPSAGRVRGIDMLSKKESYSTPSEPSTLLLDLYPNAAAAYSLRKLRTAYAGSAIRVRRSSDNAEQDINFVGNELDTASLLSFVGAGDGFVSIWYDQSGNGRDATQTTAANQPKIYDSSSGVITQGTKPAIYGDGSNDVLVYSTSSFPSTGDITFDIFHLENFTDTPSLYDDSLIAISPQTYSSDRRCITGLSYDGGANRVSLFGGNTIYTTQTVGYQLNNINYQGGGGAINARIDASDLTVSSFNNTGLNIQSSTDIRLFSGQDINTNIVPQQGYLQEVIFYFSDQSSNRTGIESNINSHYNIYWDGSQAGLLDSYPNASAAYSLRALNSAYTGAAIKVRRSSDNVEQNIRFLYDGSLDTASLLSFANGGDVFVSTWYDQSGEGNDAIQATATNQPKIVSSGSVILENGKAAIQYDSISNVMTIQNATTMQVVDNMYWAQLCSGVTSLNRGLLVKRIDDDNREYEFRYTLSTQFTYLDSNNRKNFSISSSNAQRLHSINRIANTSIDLRINDLTFPQQSLIGTQATTPANVGVGGRVESLFLYDGKMQEIILYASDQSSNRTGIESNINKHYNIY